MKVYVYYNLHKHCWSVKALEGKDKGRVIAHCDSLMLMHAEFKVSEAGRQRVIKEKRKNVHAGVTGYWIEKRSHSVKWLKSLNKQVMYNPYKYNSFVRVSDKKPVSKKATVWMSDKKVWAS
jgi:hypothetical protein